MCRLPQHWLVRMQIHPDVFNRLIRVDHRVPSHGYIRAHNCFVPQLQRFARHNIGLRYGSLDIEPETFLKNTVESAAFFRKADVIVVGVTTSRGPYLVTQF